MADIKTIMEQIAITTSQNADSLFKKIYQYRNYAPISKEEVLSITSVIEQLNKSSTFKTMMDNFLSSGDKGYIYGAQPIIGGSSDASGVGSNTVVLDIDLINRSVAEGGNAKAPIYFIGSDGRLKQQTLLTVLLHEMCHGFGAHGSPHFFGAGDCNYR